MRRDEKREKRGAGHPLVPPFGGPRGLPAVPPCPRAARPLSVQSARGADNRHGSALLCPPQGAARSPHNDDPRRVARAAKQLRVQRDGPGRFIVTGGKQPHVVTLRPRPSCDCADAMYRPSIRCAHRFAVGLFLGRREALEALRLVVVVPARAKASTKGADVALGLVP